MDPAGRRIVWDRMPSRGMWGSIALALLVGSALGAALGYLAWGRRAGAMAARLAALESAATQVQSERERLHRELDEIVRERRDMAATAERLRAQVEQQLERLEALSAELGPPPSEGDTPSGPTP
jgi:uncharacterized protein HemX